MSEQKKKLKVTTFKKIKKSDNPITQIDSQSWYVKSERDPSKEPYLVFNSNSKGFLCDCMNFVMKIEDSGKTINCKHILMVKQKFHISEQSKV